MPRKSRIDAPGALHHIIARGIEGGKIFQEKRGEKTVRDQDYELGKTKGRPLHLD